MLFVLKVISSVALVFSFLLWILSFRDNCELLSTEIFVIFFWFTVNLHLFISVRTRVPWSTCGGQRAACRIWFFPSTTWFQHMEVKSSGLAASTGAPDPSHWPSARWPHLHFLVAVRSLFSAPSLLVRLTRGLSIYWSFQRMRFCIHHFYLMISFIQFHWYSWFLFLFFCLFLFLVS